VTCRTSNNVVRYDGRTSRFLGEFVRSGESDKLSSPTYLTFASFDLHSSLRLISPPNGEQTEPVTVFRWTRSQNPEVHSYRLRIATDPYMENEILSLPEPGGERIVAPQVAVRLRDLKDKNGKDLAGQILYWQVIAKGHVIVQSGSEGPDEESQEIFSFFFKRDNREYTQIRGLVTSDLHQLGLVGARVAVSSERHAVTTNSIAETVFNGVYIVIALTTDSNGDQIDLPLQITATKEGFGPKVVNQNELPPKDADGVITVPELEMRADDGDSDGIPDIVENASPCQDANDADTDDDGIADGEEDTNKNGVKDSAETDSCRLDTDNDGIQDGTELGLTLNDIGSDTDTAIFQPDLDPSTKTNPLDDDSDKDGLSDGEEDLNHNGRVDGGETDPRSLDAGELRPNPLNAIAFPAILPFLLGD